MPNVVHWTPELDARLHALRATGQPWTDVARALGISYWSTIERGRRLHLSQVAASPAVKPPPEDNPARPPLPAGHPRSWELLVRGTMLEGTPYPLPYFL